MNPVRPYIFSSQAHTLGSLNKSGIPLTPPIEPLCSHKKPTKGQLLIGIGLSVLMLLCHDLAGQDYKLPGPGLDLPVDVDGDGLSTLVDKYLLNLWLEIGGDVNKALSHGEIVGEIIELHSFFTGPESALSPEAAVAKATRIPLSGAGITATCSTVDATAVGMFLGVTTIACIQEDATTLNNVGGMTIGDVVYATREDSTTGGVTKISVSGGAPSDAYTLPLDPSYVVVIPSINIDSPPELAWDSGSNSLLITERPTNKIWRYVVPNGPLTLLGAAALKYTKAISHPHDESYKRSRNSPPPEACKLCSIIKLS